MFAAISQGHADLSDALMLASVILFGIGAVLHAIDVLVPSRVTAFLVDAGLAVLALAFLVL